MQIWDLWYPQAGAQGMSFARGRLDDTDRLLVHAAPHILNVDVRDDGGNLLARGEKLEGSLDSPIALLERQGGAIARIDVWPDSSHIGLPVILGGGEVGILKSWWHSDAKDEWRWQVEFYNRR
jgi:hypothetical protein